MPYKNNISQAINLGRRLNSIYRVAKRWKITPTEAAELMVNVEKEQTEYKVKLMEKFKEIREGQLDIKTLDRSEYKLFIEGTIFRPPDIANRSSLTLESQRSRIKNSLNSLDMSSKKNNSTNTSEVFSIDSSDISINSDTILIDPKVLMIEHIPTRKPRNRAAINNICCCF